MKELNDMRYDRVLIGDNIRAIRKNSQQSINKVSKALDISANHLMKIETGGRGMSVEVMFKMMDTFHVDANTLLMIRPTESDKVSIDALLCDVAYDQRKYLTRVFIDMIKLSGEEVSV